MTQLRRLSRVWTLISMAYVERGVVKSKRSIWRLKTITDFFWAIVNLIGVFFATMFSMEKSDAYRKGLTSGKKWDGGGPGGPGGDHMVVVHVLYLPVVPAAVKGGKSILFIIERKQTQFSFLFATPWREILQYNTSEFKLERKD
ncbi:glycine-rich protein [Prunus dulcis]|uniref:Glycine-rich protein n=1 Tax=Prunus dulcis TaxID=3755 RepID=A0A4Y1QUW0_PRUDU|nr:glycine-rich protein [Prunus dulcis]